MWKDPTDLPDIGILRTELELAYQELADDEDREMEALDWADATLGDVADEPVIVTDLLVEFPLNEC